MHRLIIAFLVAAVCLTFAGESQSGPLIRYEGSPAIAKFIEIANSVYEKSTFMSNVITKSKGGEECIFKGTCDIGGVANEIDPEVCRQGAKATLIGRDAVVVIVNRKNPLDTLTTEQLRAVFSGKVSNWKELGGPDLPIQPIITSSISGTHVLFKRIVMGDSEFKAKVMEPDPSIVLYVTSNEGAIGFTSFFLLKEPGSVKPIKPNGKEASAANPEYPLARPLYLVTRDPPAKDVKDFLDWTLSDEGQKYLKIYFVGIKQ